MKLGQKPEMWLKSEWEAKNEESGYFSEFGDDREEKDKSVFGRSGGVKGRDLNALLTTDSLISLLFPRGSSVNLSFPLYTSIFKDSFTVTYFQNLFRSRLGIDNQQMLTHYEGLPSIKLGTGWNPRSISSCAADVVPWGKRKSPLVLVRPAAQGEVIWFSTSPIKTEKRLLRICSLLGCSIVSV